MRETKEDTIFEKNRQYFASIVRHANKRLITGGWNYQVLYIVVLLSCFPIYIIIIITRDKCQCLDQTSTT